MPVALPVEQIALAVSRGCLAERIARSGGGAGIGEAARAFLVAPGNSLDGRSRWAEFVVLAQLDAGGESFPLPELYAGAEAVMSALNLFDDLEDGDASPFVNSFGPSVAINVAGWLLVLGMDLVAEADRRITLFGERASDLESVLRRGLLQSGAGQHVDLASGASSIDEALSVVAMKSGSLVAMLCEMGAVAGGASPESVELMRSIGHHLGMASQLANDVRDFGSIAKGTLNRGASAMESAMGSPGPFVPEVGQIVVTLLARAHALEAVKTADGVGATRLRSIGAGWLCASEAYRKSSAA